MNPPYSQKGDNLHEWDFIIRMLNGLSKNATGITIVPMSVAIDTKHPLRENLLNEHRLEAVMSMPDDLFYPIGTVTCIMVFTAHTPHNNDKHHESWFGYWKDDGYRKDRVQGRIPKNNEVCEKIKDKWLTDFSNKKAIPGKSIRRKVSKDDEWCAEAYLETDYKRLSDEFFIENIKKYIAFNFSKKTSNSNIKATPALQKSFILNTANWKFFDYDSANPKSIFIIKKGKRLTEPDQNLGDIPYISSSSNNNGLDNFIDNGFTDENCLSFACYGSIGEVFYQKEKSWVSDNCNTIYLRDRKFNVYLAMFFVTLLRLEQFRFSYGMTAKKERLQSFKVKLPVDKNGNPDWQFMEDYIKSLPYSSSI